MSYSAFTTGYTPRLAVVACGLCLFAGTAAGDQRVNEMLALQQSATADDRQAQAQVDALADETQEAVSEYRVRLQELDRIRRYNDNLQRTIDDQEREKASLNRQINEFGDLEQGIVPLLMDMIEDLDRFISLDVPFLPEVRSSMLTQMRDMMDRSDCKHRRKIPARDGRLPDGGGNGAQHGILPPANWKSEASTARWNFFESAACFWPTRRQTARKPAIGIRARRSGVHWMTVIAAR